ncbi:type II 3-dehydroquinate dehydratase [Modestobacter italicus]|uniref:type II 3-dehydroquinate dehydratase n=1 Tax=Modestobacter italicus (strain DSM 44449 / CECT 9708 / BC 501) TaxID=2732864 RepID=UPI001C977650|nr:type II 3-dehydroquinate dehydratase [Modestobacter italicus]
MSSVLVLNGPNLDLLGTRKPEVYGSATLADVEQLCRVRAAELGLDVEFRQSDHEGQLIDWVHEWGRRVRAGQAIGAVYNPGAHAHTSIALRDAIEGVELPVVEVHISNVHAREQFRHHSHISPVARGVVVGLGVLGYPLALTGLAELARQPR